MQGQILVADPKTRTGMVLGDDGTRYNFDFLEWQGAQSPLAGMNVDYLADGGVAKAIYPLPAPQDWRGAWGNREPDGRLLGFLGMGFLALGFVIPVLPTIIAFILGLIGVARAKNAPGREGLVPSRIAWIGALVMLVAWIVLSGLGIGFMGTVFHGYFPQFTWHTRGVFV